MSRARPEKKIPVLALSPEEASEAISLCRDTLDELLREGAIFSLRVGSRRLVPVWALEKFLRSPPEGAGPSPVEEFEKAVAHVQEVRRLGKSKKTKGRG